jgi:hypothetical protein
MFKFMMSLLFFFDKKGLLHIKRAMIRVISFLDREMGTKNNGGQQISRFDLRGVIAN